VVEKLADPGSGGLNLGPYLAALLARAEMQADTADALEASLRHVYAELFHLDLTKFDVVTLREDAPGLMAFLFEGRQRLREKIPYWQSFGFMTQPVQAALRDVFRILRYATDMLGEAATGFEKLSPHEQPRRAFTGTSHNTHVHAAYADSGNLAFRNGDVLVVRGRAHNSAAIARIGDVDTQFSHTGIVHIDEAGRHWMVEALIEDGAVINPLDYSLGHGVGRAALYRHHDADLAARAAKAIHDRIARSHAGGWARHIPYDFTMRLKGKRALFCSKLVHLAYKDASRGSVLLPAYKTRLDMKNRSFFQGIGVKATETYAPGDIDLDPAFQLVAEWQDYRITSDLRQQDMIMTKVFAWMESHNARFKPDWLIHVIGIFGRFSSHLSSRIKDFIADVVPKVPGNMSRRCIGTVAMLHKTGEGLMPGLRELEHNTIRMTGRPLHPRETLAHLERLRDVAGNRIGYLVW
jgi:Permuted papain-like amidase enzyme, YaeF/YiiX, C92 family